VRAPLRALVQHRLALVGLGVLALVVLAAVFGEALAPYDPSATDIPGRLQAPGGDHWFGTDELGRDVFSRTLVAAQVSLRVGLISVGISLLAGVTIGLVAGYYGRFVDDALMRAMDVLFAFPAVLLAIAILAVLGPGVTNAMIAIGVVYTPIFARVTRAGVLAVREDVFVRAAQSVGAGDARIIGTHVLPNVAGPVIVQTSLSLAFAILSEAALSFLGLGVQPPTPDWGSMINEAQAGLAGGHFLPAIAPAAAVVIVVVAVNIIGEEFSRRVGGGSR
jgi:peptide/nickel transport system permease protein